VSLANFELKDFRGRAFTLADFKDDKLVVGIFLGTECPLAQLYAPRLVELSDKYKSQGVAFVGINSNQHDSITEIASYARRYEITFPILKDLGNKVADQLAAERTPEVFVWDKSCNVRYRGRIDDQYGVGVTRYQTKTHYLTDALDSLLKGNEVKSPLTEAVGCQIGRILEPDETSSVTYSNQISRILQKRCVECHRPSEIAPFSLLDYDEVVGCAEMIAEVVDDSRMPPWHADPAHGQFANDRRLSEEEKQQIFTWVENGAPEGNKKDLPAPRNFIVGSQLPRAADWEMDMRKEPFVVKAEGTVPYMNFEIDPGFTEDKWVTMAEALPGNRSVVHHIVIFIRPPDSKDARLFGGEPEFLTTYVPGYLSRPFPKGMAKYVAAGSKFVFQLHYTPVGREQTDLSSLRLLFTDPKEVTHRVVGSAVQVDHREWSIPANAKNHRSVAAGDLILDDAKLLSLFPHMHLRGKSIEMGATLPDGTEKVLLDVPNYDFNWQTTYRLKEPMPLPKGTKLTLVGHHDNSEDNLANPDPSKVIRWGDQTWEEMLVALYEWSVPLPKKVIKENRSERP